MSRFSPQQGGIFDNCICSLDEFASTMKSFFVLLLSLAAAAALGFTPSALIASQLRKQANSSARLRMGWFDFKPVHGGGSGGKQDALDEQWEAQQAILRARRGEGLDKEHLKQKYRAKKDGNVDIEAHAPKLRNIEDDIMYTDDTQASKKFKLPWEK